MTPIEEAALAFVVLAAIVGWAVDRWLVAFYWWPLVGSQWRADWRQTFAEAIPPEPEPHPDVQAASYGRPFPLEPAEAAAEITRLTEGWDDDEWEQLDPDTQAAVLIAEIDATAQKVSARAEREQRLPTRDQREAMLASLSGAEWHDEGNETTAITGQINVLDDLRLLAWDASRQVSMIKTLRAAYRQEMAWTLDWYRDRLEQRGRAA